MNFGPLMVTLLESSQVGLHDPKILWAKVQKRQRYGDGSEKQKTPTFSKLGSDIEILPPEFLDIVVPYKCAKFGKDRFGNGGAKVQKRRTYGGGG